MKSENLSSEEKYRKALELLSGQSTPFYTRDALILLEEAAKDGHAEAAFCAGTLYCYGHHHILANHNKAKTYTQMAVDSGITIALFQLINLLDYLRDVTQIALYMERLQNMAQSWDYTAMDLLVRIVQKYDVESLGITEQIKNDIICSAAQAGVPSAQIPHISIMFHGNKNNIP